MQAIKRFVHSWIYLIGSLTPFLFFLWDGDCEHRRHRLLGKKECVGINFRGEGGCYSIDFGGRERDCEHRLWRGGERERDCRHRLLGERVDFWHRRYRGRGLVGGDSDY